VIGAGILAVAALGGLRSVVHRYSGADGNLVEVFLEDEDVGVGMRFESADDADLAQQIVDTIGVAPGSSTPMQTEQDGAPG
jgi:hypothetical protein